MATYNDHFPIIKVLVANGANLEAKDEVHCLLANIMVLSTLQQIFETICDITAFVFVTHSFYVARQDSS